MILEVYKSVKNIIYKRYRNFRVKTEDYFREKRVIYLQKKGKLPKSIDLKIDDSFHI